MKETEMLFYDFSKIALYLAARGVCSVDEALTYLMAEDRFNDEMGLNVYEEVDDPSELISDIVIDQLDVEAYITENTELDGELVERISDALYEYMLKNGFLREVEEPHS